jgi:hypothetical protein
MVAVGAPNGQQFADLKALRVVRVIRLFKMVRLLRASRMFKRWETRFEINYNALALYRSVILVVVSAHWMACTWCLQANIFGVMDSWLGANGYCRAEDECDTIWEQYLPPVRVELASSCSRTRPAHQEIDSSSLAAGLPSTGRW